MVFGVFGLKYEEPLILGKSHIDADHEVCYLVKTPSDLWREVGRCFIRRSSCCRGSVEWLLTPSFIASVPGIDDTSRACFEI